MGDDNEAVAHFEGLGQVRRQIESVSKRLDEALEVFNLPSNKTRLASLENDAAAEGAWDDADKGKALLTELEGVRSEVQSMESFQLMLEEAMFAFELLEVDTSDQEEAAAISADALSTLNNIDEALGQWELRRLLSGQYDSKGIRMLITAGAGGMDAMDWASMLERMYLRYAEQSGFKVKVLDRQEGEEAGLKSCEMEIEGRFAFGYLKGEKGTHRLVRNSPFNSKGLRQTSFAGIDVMPIVDEEIKLEIDEKDIEMSFQRAGGKGGQNDLVMSFMHAGGKGGQNVNKVETGVRLLHIPTGLSVKCTEERSQLANRAIAMDRLRAKIMVVLEEQKAGEIADIRGDVVQASWGQQVRNYVLHPYKMVKDTRTGEETSDVAAVLDGKLGPFISALLRLRGQEAMTEEMQE
eukprot:gene26196-11926_t